jgi:hypothetical protein
MKKTVRGCPVVAQNAHPHTAASTLETLRKLKWGVMAHPAHSPDLVPSEPLKEALEGKRFQCDEDVKNEVHQWLCVQPTTFYYDGIKKLVRHWEKCAEKQGDYAKNGVFRFCNHQ